MGRSVQRNSSAEACPAAAQITSRAESSNMKSPRPTADQTSVPSGEGASTPVEPSAPSKQRHGAVAVGAQASGAMAAGAFAIGALAVGAIAIGALAIGRLAIKRLAVQQARFKKLEVDELSLGTLRVREIIRER